MSDELISVIAHGIAEAQGDAYAEYASEFDGYAKAALFALQKNLCGFSTNGVNVWANPADIKAVMDWQHSHSTIEDVRTNLRHWREECGKVHAHRREMLDVLKRCVAVLEDGIQDEAAGDAAREAARSLVDRMEAMA